MELFTIYLQMLNFYSGFFIDPEYKLSQLHHNNIQRKSPIIASGNTHHYNSSSNAATKKRLSPKASPVRRPRGDTKKCRKVSPIKRNKIRPD